MEAFVTLYVPGPGVLARSSVNEPTFGLGRIVYAGVAGFATDECGSMYAAGPGDFFDEPDFARDESEYLGAAEKLAFTSSLRYVPGPGVLKFCADLARE